MQNWLIYATIIVISIILIKGFFISNDDTEQIFKQKKQEAINFLKEKIGSYFIYNNKEIYLHENINEQDLIVAFSCLLNNTNKATNRTDGIVLTSLYFPELVTVLRTDADFIAFWKAESEQKQKIKDIKREIDENFVKKVTNILTENNTKYIEKFDENTVKFNLSKFINDFKSLYIDKVENELNTISIDAITQMEAIAKALGFNSVADMLINTTIYENTEKTMYIDINDELEAEAEAEEEE
jgi:uncharacterized protein YbjQ (UPF0145 family)